MKYRFSFGPWNIGADAFGTEVRKPCPHEERFALYRPLGFEGVQFHDGASVEAALAVIA